MNPPNPSATFTIQDNGPLPYQLQELQSFLIECRFNKIATHLNLQQGEAIVPPNPSKLAVPQKPGPPPTTTVRTLLITAAPTEPTSSAAWLESATLTAGRLTTIFGNCTFTVLNLEAEAPYQNEAPTELANPEEHKEASDAN